MGGGGGGVLLFWLLLPLPLPLLFAGGEGLEFWLTGLGEAGGEEGVWGADGGGGAGFCGALGIVAGCPPTVASWNRLG